MKPYYFAQKNSFSLKFSQVFLHDPKIAYAYGHGITREM